MKKMFVFVTILLVAVALYANQQPKNHPAAAKVISLSMFADHSGGLIRINQMDSAQYASTQEYDTWAVSACSAASMTEVINFYSSQHPYTIHTILADEQAVQEITPDEGLLEEVGIARTVGKLGFQTDWGHERSLQQVIDVANSGRPVIVSIPPHRDSDFWGGHILVAIGGNATSVFVADSSVLNKHSFSRDEFAVLWSGFSAVVTPGGQ